VLAALVGHTRWGRRLRVVGASPAAAERSGSSPAVVRSGALARWGAVAVLAGLLIAPVTFVGVGQAAPLTVRGVAAAALLGPGGPRWAVPGGLALGAVEAVSQSVWPRAGGEVGVAMLVVLLLVWRGSERSQAWGRAW
jgi:branched-chain amino acid transport system permease protein